MKVQFEPLYNRWKKIFEGKLPIEEVNADLG